MLTRLSTQPPRCTVRVSKVAGLHDTPTIVRTAIDKRVLADKGCMTTTSMIKEKRAARNVL